MKEITKPTENGDEHQMENIEAPTIDFKQGSDHAEENCIAGTWSPNTKESAAQLSSGPSSSVASPTQPAVECENERDKPEAEGISASNVSLEIGDQMVHSQENTGDSAVRIDKSTEEGGKRGSNVDLESIDLKVNVHSDGHAGDHTEGGTDKPTEAERLANFNQESEVERLNIHSEDRAGISTEAGVEKPTEACRSPVANVNLENADDQKAKVLSDRASDDTEGGRGEPIPGREILMANVSVESSDQKVNVHSDHSDDSVEGGRDKPTEASGKMVSNVDLETIDLKVHVHPDEPEGGREKTTEAGGIVVTSINKESGSQRVDVLSELSADGGRDEIAEAGRIVVANTDLETDTASMEGARESTEAGGMLLGQNVNMEYRDNTAVNVNSEHTSADATEKAATEDPSAGTAFDSRLQSVLGPVGEPLDLRYKHGKDDELLDRTGIEDKENVLPTSVKLRTLMHFEPDMYIKRQRDTLAKRDEQISDNLIHPRPYGGKNQESLLEMDHSGDDATADEENMWTLDAEHIKRDPAYAFDVYKRKFMDLHQSLTFIKYYIESLESQHLFAVPFDINNGDEFNEQYKKINLLFSAANKFKSTILKFANSYECTKFNLNLSYQHYYKMKELALLRVKGSGGEKFKKDLLAAEALNLVRTLDIEERFPFDADISNAERVERDSSRDYSDVVSNDDDFVEHGNMVKNEASVDLEEYISVVKPRGDPLASDWVDAGTGTNELSTDEIDPYKSMPELEETEGVISPEIANLSLIISRLKTAFPEVVNIEDADGTDPQPTLADPEIANVEGDVDRTTSLHNDAHSGIANVEGHDDGNAPPQMIAHSGFANVQGDDDGTAKNKIVLLGTDPVGDDDRTASRHSGAISKFAHVKGEAGRTAPLNIAEGKNRNAGKSKTITERQKLVQRSSDRQTFESKKAKGSPAVPVPIEKKTVSRAGITITASSRVPLSKTPSQASSKVAQTPKIKSVGSSTISAKTQRLSSVFAGPSKAPVLKSTAKNTSTSSAPSSSAPSSAQKAPKENVSSTRKHLQRK